MDIRNLHTIISVEETPLEVELAGFASRILAFAVDFMIMACIFTLLVMSFSQLIPFSLELAKTLLNLLMVGAILWSFFYHFIQEWLWNGQTLGKAIFKLQVIREDGQPISFWESLGRNILRFVDVYLLGIGVLTILFTRQEKRFGDLLVGSLVIHKQKIRTTVVQAPLERELREIPLNETLTLTQYDWLLRFQDRQAQMLPAKRTALWAQFKSLLMTKHTH